MTIKIIRCLFALILVVSMNGSAAFAQNASSTPVANPDGPLPSMAFGPKPTEHGGRFSVELEPGESTKFTAILENNGEIPFEFITYAADAFTPRNGGFGILEYPSEPSGTTTWLDYPTETYFMEPGETFERSFTVEVPVGTSPGEYVTGIGMQTAKPVNSADEGMFRLDQIFRTVLGIRILVPGELKAALAIDAPEMIVEGSIPGVRIPISNTGNVRTTTSGNVAIADATGFEVLAGTIQLGPIFGGHDTEIVIGLPGVLPPGNYTLDLNLTDEAGVSMVEAAKLPFTVEESTEGVAGLSPIRIAAATLNALPDETNVQLALIEATISNTADPIANAQLSLIVSVDGIEVERFAINQSLALLNGDTAISARYLPLSGWTSGEWTFELVLETVDSGGVATVLDRHVFEEAITIP